MKSYYQAISQACQSGNMPFPDQYPGKFITWCEDICELISYIYDRDYDQVIKDIQEKLDILEDE